MKFSYTPARLAVLGLCLSSAAALAQTQQPVTGSLRDTVVTANRAEQPQDQVIADLTVIDRDEIDRSGANSLLDLLGGVPGVQVLGRNSVYLRGAEGRMTALYIDGVRVDSQDGFKLIGGGAHWDLVPLAQIDRIEVLRGAASSLYGSDAMGGVVQLFTKRASKPFAPWVSLSAGTQQTYQAASGFSGTQGAWDYSVDVSREISDGYNSRPDLVFEPRNQERRQSAANVRLGLALDHGQRLELTRMESELKTRYPDAYGYGTYADHARLTVSGLQWQARWSEAFSTRLAVSESVTDRQDTYPYDYRTRIQSNLVDNRLKIAGGELSLSAEQRTDRFNSTEQSYVYNGNLIIANAAIDKARTQNALATGFSRRKGDHGIQLSFRVDDDEFFGKKETGSVAYSHSLNKNWRVSATAGTAFRAPTVEQLFNVYGKPTLLPETSKSKELALEYAARGTNFKAVVFKQDIRNLISSATSRTDCAAGWFCYYNVGEAAINGVTLSANTLLGAYLVRGSLDLLDPKNLTTNTTLSLRARKQATLAVGRALSNWQVGANLKLIGEKFNNAANTERTPGYGVVGLTASRPLSQDLSLMVRVDNLSNKQHWESLEYAAPRRTALATLKWQPRH